MPTLPVDKIQPERILKELRRLWVDLGKQDEQGILRACAMTFIALVEDDGDASPIGELIAALMHEHPSRAIVVRINDEPESALSAHPKIDLVYAHNDPMAMGAYLAARAKGRDSTMTFVGIDGLPGLDGGRQAVKDGKLAATFVYPTGGKEAVDIAVKILRRETVPHRITLGTERITKGS